MKIEHLRGLDQDYKRGLKQARRMGGPSDALRRIKRRPGGGSWGSRRKDGYTAMDGRGLVICVKCGEKKLNGYLEEGLCEECYESQLY